MGYRRMQEEEYMCEMTNVRIRMKISFKCTECLTTFDGDTDGPGVGRGVITSDSVLNTSKLGLRLSKLGLRLSKLGLRLVGQGLG